jgi:hypothetical protein
MGRRQLEHLFLKKNLIRTKHAHIAVTINLAGQFLVGLYGADSLLHGAILGFALEVLSADGPRLPIDDLRVGIHGAPVELGVTELALEAGF